MCLPSNHPQTQVKINYIDKLLAANKAANLEPLPALVTGLDIINRQLAAQPPAVVISSLPQLLLLLDTAFCSPYEHVLNLLASVLHRLYTAFPIGRPDTPKEVRWSFGAFPPPPPNPHPIPKNSLPLTKHPSLCIFRLICRPRVVCLCC
jgi:hypothetical protein